MADEIKEIVYEYDPVTKQQDASGYWRLTEKNAAVCKLSPAEQAAAFSTRFNIWALLAPLGLLALVAGAVAYSEKQRKKTKRGTRRKR